MSDAIVVVLTVLLSTGDERRHTYELPASREALRARLHPVLVEMFQAMTGDKKSFGLDGPKTVYNSSYVVGVEMTHSAPTDFEEALKDADEIFTTGFLRGRPS